MKALVVVAGWGSTPMMRGLGIQFLLLRIVVSGLVEVQSLEPSACNSLADNENMVHGGDALGAGCPQPPWAVNKMRVRSAHWAEGRKLQMKSPGGVQQGL
jgi:hypothetical protein